MLKEVGYFKTMTSLLVSARQERNKVIRESEPGHKHVLIQHLC